MTLSQREAFSRTMEHLVNCSKHGYSQANRWGNGKKEQVDLGDDVTVEIMEGDRDCSSAIISALVAVGVDTFDATYTGNMKSNLLKTGLFEWKNMSFSAERGDIYLNEVNHVAMCTSPYGSNKGDLLAEFSISENNTIYGKSGDQTGWESHITTYYDYPWDGILHWKNDGETIGIKREEQFLMAQKNEFMYLVEPDNCGKNFLVHGANINHVPNPEALKYLLREYKEVTGSDMPNRKIGSKKNPEGLRLFQALGHEDLYKKEVEPYIS